MRRTEDVADSERRDAAESTPKPGTGSSAAGARDDNLAEPGPEAGADGFVAGDGLVDGNGFVDDKVDLVEEFADETAPADEVREASLPVTERDAEDDGELVSVAAARTGTTRTNGSSRTAKKGRATPRQRATRTGKRAGPVAFVQESIAELRKVVYPTGPQLLNYFVVVLIFVLFVIAFVSLLDLVFGWAILKVFS
jgi:preprotein translocase subunit SecE